ncbi:putative bifunctional diguanylate cyclase/phosphodiesterase [Frateuria defendens]|uniref:putative bifunctional diguanylate cyclase/phosphodiesterase n=1 Tax=Frateuria defendens TaxID=2219559 RepID=UPI00301A8E67
MAVIGLILVLTWGALQIQVALAGFLNGESVWSKAQKQAAIDLGNYAVSGDARELARFRQNYAMLAYDRQVRDAAAGDHFNYSEAAAALRHGNTIPAAIPGVLFMLRYLPGAPYLRDALAAWRSTDEAIGQLERIADDMERGYAAGRVTPLDRVANIARIHQLSDYIEPRAQLFSQRIADAANRMGWILFGSVAAGTLLACFLWLRMARRVVAGIRGSEERYRLVFDSAADAIVMVDEASGAILDVNSTATTWTGRVHRALVGQPLETLFAVQPEPGGTGLLRGADGDRPVDVQSSLAQWGAQTVRQAIIRDITERLKLEQERRIAAEALASVAEGVIIADAGRRIVSTNAAHDSMTGYGGQSLLGRPLEETRSLPDGTPLPDSIWADIDEHGHWQGEVASRRRDGSSYPELLSISAIRDAQRRIQHYVAVFTNISVTKASQQRLEYLAAHDPLTELANRAEFERQCTKAIAAAVRGRNALAVLFVDLDAFKVVNDSYSHAIGDRLLAKVAERIRCQLGPNDLAGRIGGDEFTVLTSGLQERGEAAVLARRLLAALAEPMTVGDYEIVLSASIGVAGYPLDGMDATTLIANADAAMYVAKTEERNAFRLYSPMMQADARRRLALLVELRRALSENEFRLAYQPTLELRSGRIVAVEALLRWQHPERGEIQPGEFIPLAEKLGLIRHIDEWVLQAACAQMRQWEQAGLPAIRVAVNVSASWFGHSRFVEEVRDALATWQIDPARLLLEVTEGAILRLGEDMVRAMQALHALGVGVAIDDFGTGYSSLSYLKLPAIACLKIDQSFVAGLPSDANDTAIVEAMLTLARNLGLYAIAEGVENEAQHAFLSRAGCAEGQGFLYARPLSSGELERLLRRSGEPGPQRLYLVPPAR